MNWYIKNIFAQENPQTGLERYLSSLGATPDITQYILSLNLTDAKYLTNEIRKTPTLTLQQLQEIQQPQKINPYLSHEEKMASGYDIPQFKKWILVNYRKLRRGINDLAQLPQEELLIYDDFSHKINEIHDWYKSINPDISGYDTQQAIVASDEWHRMMAGKGEGSFYEQTKQELISYGPQWKNPEWQGWTIQKVIGENDLLVEGNRMEHCVGDYCRDVNNGTSVIFSLRDMQNKPHVTMETSGGDSYTPGTIKQIRGVANSEPKEVYKEMIKEWIATKGKESGVNNEINTFEEMEENASYDGLSVENINNGIEKILQQDTNEYGLTHIFDSDIDSVLNTLNETAEGEQTGYGSNRTAEYYGNITESTDYIVNLAIMQDLHLKKWPQHSSEYNEMILNNDTQSNWENIQEIEQWAWEAIDEIQEDFYEYDTGLIYPNENDFDAAGEYQQKIEEFQDAEAEMHDEWLKSTLKGGFAKDLLNELEAFRKKKVIPTSQELFDIKKEKEKQELLKSTAYQEAYSRGQQMVNNTSIATNKKNWYKKAQGLELDEDYTGSYLDFGHDKYFREDVAGDEPNYMWAYIGGNVITEEETDYINGHGESLKFTLEESQYSGRYSGKEKVITIVRPTKGVMAFRAIPNFLQLKLKQAFPKALKLVTF